MGLNRCRHDLPCRPGPAGAGPSGKAIPGKRFVGDCDPTEPRPSGSDHDVLPPSRSCLRVVRSCVRLGCEPKTEPRPSGSDHDVTPPSRPGLRVVRSKHRIVQRAWFGLPTITLPGGSNRKQSRDRQGAITMFRPPSRSGLRVMRSGLHVVRKSLRSAIPKTVGTRFWVPTVFVS